MKGSETLSKKQKKSQYNRKYYLCNKEKLEEKKKIYYLNNKDKYSKRAKRYYNEHQAEISIKHKEYYEKNKFKPSKKISKLIEITVSIPTIEEIQGAYEHAPIDHRRDVEEYILSALETLSQKTKCEDTCKDLIEKARRIFEFYDNER